MVGTRETAAVLAVGMIAGAALLLLGDAAGRALASQQGGDGWDVLDPAPDTDRAITDAVGDLTRWAREHEGR